jgi:hypothetical protein
LVMTGRRSSEVDLMNYLEPASKQSLRNYVKEMLTLSAYSLASVLYSLVRIYKMALTECFMDGLNDKMGTIN